MIPTYKNGTGVICYKWAYLKGKPKKKEIVVAKVGGKNLIKRVTNVDGDKVFLVGDNQNQSTDSRAFGWVNSWQIIGKVIYSFS